MNFKKYFFVIVISIFVISACAGINTASNRKPLPSILSNYDKTTDLSTQALLHIQQGLKIVECDQKSTVDPSTGEAWGAINTVQFIAVLAPGSHSFKIDLNATFYYNNFKYTYSASDMTYSYDFVAGRRYSLRYELYDDAYSKEKRVKLIMTDRTDNPHDPEWPTFLKRLESL